MAYEKVVYVNGAFITSGSSDLFMPLEERALQFGDGIYEVVRIYKGRYFMLEEHIDRFYRSMEKIGIAYDNNKEELTNDLLALIERNHFTEDGIVYMQISRGSAPRNHVFPENIQPNIYAYIKEAPIPMATMGKGVKAIIEEDIRWLRCDVKSLNLLGSVLTKQKATEADAYEAILTRGDVVTEGSSSNIYAVKDGVVITHPENNLVLPGIVRLKVKQLCKEQHIPFIELPMTTSFLLEADELFLTSTTSEITPITQVDQTMIGQGKVGDVTRKLQALYQEAIDQVTKKNTVSKK